MSAAQWQHPVPLQSVVLCVCVFVCVCGQSLLSSHEEGRFLDASAPKAGSPSLAMTQVPHACAPAHPVLTLAPLVHSGPVPASQSSGSDGLTAVARPHLLLTQTVPLSLTQTHTDAHPHTPWGAAPLAGAQHTHPPAHHTRCAGVGVGVQVATSLALAALVASVDPTRKTPFQEHSKGRYQGGKQDDITVVVGLVVPSGAGDAKAPAAKL